MKKNIYIYFKFIYNSSLPFSLIFSKIQTQHSKYLNNLGEVALSIQTNEKVHAKQKVASNSMQPGGFVPYSDSFSFEITFARNHVYNRKQRKNIRDHVRE